MQEEQAHGHTGEAGSPTTQRKVEELQSSEKILLEKLAQLENQVIEKKIDK